MVGQTETHLDPEHLSVHKIRSVYLVRRSLWEKYLE